MSDITRKNTHVISESAEMLTGPVKITAVVFSIDDSEAGAVTLSPNGASESGKYMTLWGVLATTTRIEFDGVVFNEGLTISRSTSVTTALVEYVALS